jgi:hypothetical protein
MALVAMAPAGAAPPKCAGDSDAPGCPPPEEVTRYEAVFGFIESRDGFSTTPGCTDGSAVTMDITPQGHLGAVFDRTQFLDVRIGAALHWYRHFPYFATPGDVPDEFVPGEYPLVVPVTGAGLTGCHGGGVAVTIKWVDGVKVLDPDRPIEEVGGLFRLTPSDGLIELLWHSDYYVEYENVGKKKPRYLGNYGEDFTYSGAFGWTDEDTGDPVVWDPATGASGIVDGNMGVSHWWKSPESAGYTPFDEAGFPVRFHLTITPIEG